MQAWLNKRRIVLASLLVAGLSAPAGSATSLPEPLGTAGVAIVGKYPTIAPTNAPTSDPTTVAKSSDGRYTKGAGARKAAQATFCANLKLTHNWAQGILAGRWSQDAMVAMFQSEIDAARNSCAWAK
jgi:hypothetical protein